MKSPWKSMQPTEPDRDYLAVATAIPVRGWSSTGHLFRGASAVRKQLASSDGVIGFSLLARPLRKQYATISLWDDESSLAAFTRAHPHGRLRHDLAPELGHAGFVRWTIKGADGPPSWREALRRLSEHTGSES